MTFYGFINVHHRKIQHDHRLDWEEEK